MKEAKKFIKENMSEFSIKDYTTGKDDDLVVHGKDVVFTMNQKPWKKFMSDRGITSDIISTYNKAEREYANAALSVMSDELIADKEVFRTTLRTSTPTVRDDVGVKRSRKTNNPTTKESAIKFGRSFSNVKNRKFDKELLSSISAAVEKASK